MRTAGFFLGGRSYFVASSPDEIRGLFASMARLIAAEAAPTGIHPYRRSGFSRDDPSMLRSMGEVRGRSSTRKSYRG
jgi:cation transport regulator ChaB